MELKKAKNLKLLKPLQLLYAVAVIESSSIFLGIQENFSLFEQTRLRWLGQEYKL